MEHRKTKGFTLAELLIVVAIIGVLVAIIIPVFNKQLEKSRRAVDVDNARSMLSVLAVSLTDGALSMDADNRIYFVVYSDKNKNADGGTQYGKAGNIKINNSTYSSGSEAWDAILKPAGFDRTTTHAQQKNIDHYGVCIYGDGASYYFEWKDRKGYRYQWGDVSKEADTFTNESVWENHTVSH